LRERGRGVAEQRTSPDEAPRGIDPFTLTLSPVRNGGEGDVQAKRDLVGTFHWVSATYPPLPVAEFQFRYDDRLNDDIFGPAISAR
jgi:hypothetical protein